MTLAYHSAGVMVQGEYACIADVHRVKYEEGCLICNSKLVFSIEQKKSKIVENIFHSIHLSVCLCGAHH